MFTVLILSKDTFKDFLPFRPLFSDAISSGELGICEWVEDAYTIETAVPDLYRLIANKKEWRAIIVSTEPSAFDEIFGVDNINPYDYQTAFSLNRIMGEVVDAGPPLVRLAHLLTGTIPQNKPPLDYRLDYPVVQNEINGQNEYGIPSFQFTEKRIDPETAEMLRDQEEMRQEWMRRHSFDEILPTEIQMIKTRSLFTETELLRTVTNSWNVYTEFDSSEFWKRNYYPQCCRFLVYDMEGHGDLQKQNNLFRLWCCVGLMAENEIDPNVLQAHRLYRLSCRIDANELSAYFQNTVNRVNKIKYLLEKQIARERLVTESGARGIPAFKAQMDMEYEPVQYDNFFIKTDEIRLSGGAGSDDLTGWKEYNENYRSETKSMQKKLQRSIDRSVNTYRPYREYYWDEVYQLSNYLEEDLNDELENLQNHIFTEQLYIPETVSYTDRDVEDLNREVEQHMQARMSRVMILGLVAVIAAMIISMAAPAFIMQRITWRYALLVLLFMLVPILYLWIFLIGDRRRLISEMRSVERLVLQSFDDLNTKSNALMEYLSSLYSHVRGASFLRIMNTQKMAVGSSLYAKQRRLKDVEVFTNTLSKWNIVLHLGLNMAGMTADTDDSFSRDLEDNQLESMMLMQRNRLSQVDLNETGITIQSAYPFVRKLSIERLELYDDPDDFDELGNRIIRNKDSEEES